MRTRRSNYPNNSNVTIPRRRRRQVSNIVEPEIRTIVAPMAERTMEELLRAPTEGYGEAIVLPEINADHFEIKTNLLQLVQANPFYGHESENPHAHINIVKRITSLMHLESHSSSIKSPFLWELVLILVINYPPKAPIFSYPEQCNQTINELPQTLPSVHPTFNSEDKNSFIYDSKPNSFNDSPSVFTHPPQLQFETYLCEFVKIFLFTFVLKGKLSRRPAYTTLSNPQGVIYKDKLKRKRFMRADELHKFSDDTLILVRDTLDQMLHELHLGYNSAIRRRLWNILDQQRTRIMIKAINQKLLDRRIMRSLEKFIGGREYGEDLRLLQRTI
ncbi:hypothetical protein Tco_0384880 [Tanacetum coccineum]